MPTTFPRRTSCAALAAAATLLAMPAPAAEPGSDPGPSSGRTLNGHAFMPAADVPGPFVATSFGTGLIMGVGTTDATWQVGDQTLTGKLDYAGIGAVLGYEYAFGDRLSARVSITELIFSGINGKSAVVIGSKIQGGGSVGLTYSMPLGDSARVGVLFDAGYQPNFGLTIGAALKSAIDSCSQPDGCSVDPGSAFQQQNTLTLQPALAASWAPTKALGLTTNAAYLYASQTVNGTEFTGHAVVLGAAADYDFGAVSSVPIGLQAQFSWTAPSGEGLQQVTDLGGGIFYTGRKDLALGLQLIDRRFAVVPDVDVSWSTFLATVGMRYYW
jgi:hypothetical protein